MNVDRKCLIDVIAWEDQVRFVIPPWQRHFTWGDSEVIQMWHDWKTVCDQGQKHFCGMMLFRKMSEEALPTWEVVDGQQRITTFFLFFIAARDVCAIQEIDFSALNQIFTTQDSSECRLDLQEGMSDDHQMINALLQRRQEGVDKTVKERSLVIKAYDLFRTQLLSMDRKAIPSFILNVLQNLELIVLTSDPGDEVRRIFETLNSRGKHIDPDELVANLVTYIGKPNSALNEQARGTWSFITRSIDQDDLAIFLDTFARRNGKQSERGSTFDEIKFEVDQALRNDNMREWLHEFERAARNYNDILFPHNTDDPVQGLLEELKRLRVPKLNPFLLALLEAFRETPASEPLIHNVVSLCVRVLINYDRPSYRLEQFATKACEAFYETGESNAAHLEKIITLVDEAWIDDATFHHAFSMKSIYGPGPHLSRLRYYLEKLEQKIDAVTGQPFEVHFGPQTTVEHIMPQTLDEGGYWKNALRTSDPLRLESQHKALVHTIGNLTVLLTTDNPAAGNTAYAQKREFYLHPNETLQSMGLRARRARIGNCALNSYFENVSVWNFNAIATRSRYLSDLAVQIWNKQDWSRETT
jgi:hypothetical protein